MLSAKSLPARWPHPRYLGGDRAGAGLGVAAKKCWWTVRRSPSAPSASAWTRRSRRSRRAPNWRSLPSRAASEVRAPDGKVGWVKATALNSARNLSAGNAELVRNADSSGLNTTLAARGNLEEGAQADARRSAKVPPASRRCWPSASGCRSIPSGYTSSSKPGRWCGAAVIQAFSRTTCGKPPSPSGGGAMRMDQ